MERGQSHREREWGDEQRGGLLKRYQGRVTRHGAPYTSSTTNSSSFFQKSYLPNPSRLEEPVIISNDKPIMINLYLFLKFRFLSWI